MTIFVRCTINETDAYEFSGVSTSILIFVDGVRMTFGEALANKASIIGKCVKTHLNGYPACVDDVVEIE